MTDPTEINSVYWNEEKKSWEHKMIQNIGSNMLFLSFPAWRNELSHIIMINMKNYCHFWSFAKIGVNNLDGKGDSNSASDYTNFQFASFNWFFWEKW